MTQRRGRGWWGSCTPGGLGAASRNGAAGAAAFSSAASLTVVSGTAGRWPRSMAGRTGGPGGRFRVMRGPGGEETAQQRGARARPATRPPGPEAPHPLVAAGQRSPWEVT